MNCSTPQHSHALLFRFLLMPRASCFLSSRNEFIITFRIAIDRPRSRKPRQCFAHPRPRRRPLSASQPACLPY